MPSAAANAKPEKQASPDSQDNTPIRQIVTVIEHKIRNLEKRKSKLTSYRDLQKTGKELNADQKVAVAKYDEVVQTLEFARDLSKQVTAIVTAAEKEAKKQAKKEAWARYAAETNKIREVLLILDCLMQMGNVEAREDFLQGKNGAAKLTEEDLKILDDLYPEVTPKHEVNEEGQPGFHAYTIKASEHLYSIIDGKPKEVLGTTYAHIKEIVNAVHECGYFDKGAEADSDAVIEEEQLETAEEEQELDNPLEAMHTPTFVQQTLPIQPVPPIITAAAYQLPTLPPPPMTVQEVEHAYFSQQYPQPRPISEVIGSQNFFFLQKSEIDSPIGTPQPPPVPSQLSPPGPIPTQTFTNQHFVPMPPQPHFPAHPEHAYSSLPMPHPTMHQQQPQQHHQQPQQPTPPPAQEPQAPTAPTPPPTQEPETSNNDDEWKEEESSPEQNDSAEQRAQGDGQNKFRRYGRNNSRGSNGYRGRGGFQNRQNSDGYHGKYGGDYQNRGSSDYQNRGGSDYQNRGGSDYQNRGGSDSYRSSRQYNDNYQRHGKDGYQGRGGNNGYYGNGDFNGNQHSDRDRYTDNYQGGGYKGRGRGGRGRPPRAHYARRSEHAD